MRWRVLAAVVVAGCGVSSLGPAQELGEEAELKRLERRAEDSIAVGDAEGAAMNMGKAALMAARLAQGEQREAGRRLFEGIERLFRAQEHAYRAVALFERAGGRPPASSGVCATLQLADRDVKASGETLSLPAPAGLDPSTERTWEHYRTMVVDWVDTIDLLQADFHCAR